MLATLFAIVMTILLLRRGKGFALGPALLLAASAPVFAGLYYCVDCLIRSSSICVLADVQLKASEWAGAVQDGCEWLLDGFRAAIPIYFIGLVTLIVRSLKTNSNELKRPANRKSSTAS